MEQGVAEAVTRAGFSGRFVLEHIRNGEVIAEIPFDNGATDEGLLYVLDAAFNNTSPTANWYIGLIDDDGFTEIASDDTAADHGGWTEFTTYSSSTRPAWNKGAAATNQIASSSNTSFTMSTLTPNTEGLRGAFIISNSTKSGTSGKLWAHGTFARVAVETGDIIRINYTTALAAG